MANKISLITIAFMVLASTLTLFQTTNAKTTTYTVGDSTGWQIPSGNVNLYDDWAENKNFSVGDVLVFNFTTERHNVVEVTEPGYYACTMTDTISTENNGPAKITLNTLGEHYFVCSFPGHCSAGEKLKVKVLWGGKGKTHSAGSSVVATISLVFMSIAFVLLCYFHFD